MRILALDYGIKRIGIAVTDPLQLIANPLTTTSSKEIFSFIHSYLLKEQVEIIVLGYPLGLDGKPTETTLLVEKFEEKLKKKFPEIVIEREDERFTSKIAVKAMVEGGMKKKDRRKKENVDMISASLILASYLERKNH